MFYLKEKITDQTSNSGRRDVEIMVPLKFPTDFWRILKMALINCESNLILTWYANCVIAPYAAANQATKFEINKKNFMFQL